ncbi:hypothetical protein QR98_0078920 [Sarcoptes scabiei]|uniref:Uncharacterized protein n=1 Tax=Sarcoptes scabiei TaxID=52283 RepID=A0A132AEE5_SARSC|nr:hypothetical protein QR98_0078920 [Sarcoptes scabiei]
MKDFSLFGCKFIVSTILLIGLIVAKAFGDALIDQSFCLVSKYSLSSEISIGYERDEEVGEDEERDNDERPLVNGFELDLAEIDLAESIL